MLKVFSETLDKPGPILSLKLMFPHADHGPAASAQGAVYAAVAGLVGGDLVSPELRVGLGLGAVPGAAVPEAAAHKYRGLALGLRVRQLFCSGDYYTSTWVIEGLVWGVDRGLPKG